MHTSQTPHDNDPLPNQRLLTARLERHLTQAQLADLLGTDANTVSRWERGLQQPSPFYRERLCKLFALSDADLGLGGAETSPPAAGVSPDRRILDPMIPPPPRYLFGRETDLFAVKERLFAASQQKEQIVALTGLPGVGKTALATTLAHDPLIRAHFPDGVLWAGLGPHPEISAVLSRWARLLDLSAADLCVPTESGSFPQLIRSAIGIRAFLLVIDDAWRLEDVMAFQIGGPACAYLVTTRLRDVAASLALDEPLVLHELRADDSLALLRRFAPGVLDQERQKAQDLVRATGGLPLALCLIGHFLRQQAALGQRRRIQAALAHLSRPEERLRLGEPQPREAGYAGRWSGASLSLYSAIAISDRQLSPQAHTALCVLSIFPAKPHSFSEEAALAVTGSPAEVLDELLDAGLMEPAGMNRYRLHQTIADYARLQLVPPTNLAAYERLIAYCIHFVEQHQADYDQLEQESRLFHVALDQAHALAKDSELVRLSVTLAPYLLLRGRYQLAERYFHLAQDAAIRRNDQRGLVRILRACGELAQKQGRYDQAQASFRQGVTLARQNAEQEEIAALLTDLGWVLWKQGAYSQAQSCLEEALVLTRQVEDDKQLCRALTILGAVVARQGDYARSGAYLQEGLALARERGDQEQLCALLINLGVTSLNRGDASQAEGYLNEGLSVARTLGHREWTSLLLLNLADLWMGQGQQGPAEVAGREGLDLARQIGHRELISGHLLNQGVLAAKEGRYQQAEASLQEGLQIARELGSLYLMGTALYESGNCALLQQHIEQAEAYFKEIEACCQPDQELLALASFGRAQVAALRGAPGDARRLAMTSLRSLEAMGSSFRRVVRDWITRTFDPARSRAEHA
jgi:tetratricopeptide (TPR) repeat protein/transcriptional regulator with XRE-family HTH domain